MKNKDAFKWAAVALLAFGFCLCLRAMDRWAALSQLESGDNDHATGHGGEVSRYQVEIEVWRQYAPTNADWNNPTDSLAVAKSIMQARCNTFEHDFHRQPGDFEFYVLWNAPAQIPKPGKSVAERAKRFCNLISATNENQIAPTNQNQNFPTNQSSKSPR